YHVLALLVHDRINGDCFLAGASVSNQQLSLSPADGDHGVDGLHARLKRLPHGLAIANTRRLELHRPPARALDLPQVVHGHTEGVDHPADQLVPNRYFKDPSRSLDLAALVEV